MDLFTTGLSDLATGAGVAAIASVSTLATDAAVGLAIAGGAAGLALCAAERLLLRPRSAPEVQLARHVLRLVLSAAQFFRMWDAKDGDVGAILVAVPLFLCVCAPPTTSLPEYVRATRALSAALNAACVVGALVHSFTETEAAATGEQDKYPYSEAGLTTGVLAFLAVVNVAFSVASPGWPSGSDSLWSAAGRSAAYAVLAAVPTAGRALLRCPQPDWLLVLFGMALVQSTHVHACCLRLAFFSNFSLASPQRSLMLLVTPALAVGFVERRGDAASASWGVLAVVAVGLLRSVVPCKWDLRKE